MKSLIQAVAVVLALGSPIASFAQSAQPASQDTQAQQSQPTQQDNSQASTSGYGSGSHGSWQSGSGNDTVVSSYSPPVHTVR